MKTRIRYIIWFLVILSAAFQFGCAAPSANRTTQYDVVVYGGTSGGVIAAVQAARMGKSVVLLEQGRYLGGLTTGGLGATDIGNKAAVGGMAKDFYHHVYLHYTKDDNWVYQQRQQYEPGKKWDAEKTWWMFEPHVAEAIFDDMIRRAKVPVVYGQRLELKNGVRKEGGRITAIMTESGRLFTAKMFIDATYEGDLMALAGVFYTVGRESNATYNETLNGVQTENARYHQFEKPVDPYVKPGDKASGLLPGVHSGGPGKEGRGDHRVQAYNYRMCLTDVPENRIPFPKPKTTTSFVMNCCCDIMKPAMVNCPGCRI